MYQPWKWAGTIGVLLSLTIPLYCADLTTKSGKFLTNAALKTAAAGCVLILHDGGETSLPLSELPDNFLVALSDYQRSALQKDSDLVLVSGKTYRQIVVVSAGNHQLQLTHADGEAIVAETELPSSFRSILTEKQRRLLTAPSLTRLKSPLAPSNNFSSSVQTSDSVAVSSANAITATTLSQIDQNSSSSATTSNGRTIYTGPRGGHYYINSKGNKVYVKSC